jgi:pancreatic triacylglycerol lipase
LNKDNGTFATMKVVVGLVACIALASARIIDSKADASEVCYEKYGCFDTSSPWTSLLRPLRATPNAPYEVGTRFILFTRGSHETEQIGYELLPDKDAILRFSDFNAERKTYFLIHGFTDNHKVDWLWNTKDLLLKNEDVNIIAVDWAAGAKSPYLQATANSRLVGAMIARMITYLEQKADLNTDDIHIISHSLGSHVAGYAGDRLLGRIARITAIDPMDLYFGGTDPIVRLDTTDAKFVEVIHSNAAAVNNLGLGIPGAIGHVDLYPNGGSKQPGCRDTLGNLIISIIDLVLLNFEGAISTWACSHVRAAHFYAESISDTDSCPFVSFPCQSFSEFEKGNCYQLCTEPGKCAPLGYNAKKHDVRASGTFYLRTTDGANNRTYCKQVVQLQVPVSLIQEQTTGSLTITFRAEDGSLSDTFVLADNVKISPGQILQQWVEIPNYILRDPGHKPSIMLRYTRGGLLPGNQAKTLSLDSINLVIIRPDLASDTSNYRGVTLNYGTDTVISD